MNHFQPRNGALYAEDVPLAKIAKEVGTPAYVYSTATLTRHLSVVQSAFAALPSLVCCSVKACSTLAVLRLFAKKGAGFDIVSVGELGRVEALAVTCKRSSSPGSANEKTSFARC